MGLRKYETGFIRADKSIKDKVSKAVAGTRYSIGSFYDEAAKEKLKTFTKKNKK
jgi:hypothetical protein